MNIGEIREKLNTDLIELTEESARLNGLKQKEAETATGIDEICQNILAVKARVADLQDQLVAAVDNLP